MIKLAALRKDGKIYTGKRHSHIFAQESMGVLRCAEQGFVTDTGEFVDRETAAKIAYESGQIPEPKKILFSEDYIEYKE